MVKLGPASGALITLPPPREVARPEMKRSQLVPARDGMMEEEWVTVYGYEFSAIVPYFFAWIFLLLNY